MGGLPYDTAFPSKYSSKLFQANVQQASAAVRVLQLNLEYASVLESLSDTEHFPSQAMVVIPFLANEKSPKKQK